MITTGKRRIAWACCVIGTAIAYMAVVIPERAEIRALLVDAQTLYTAANRDERTVALEPSLQAALRRTRRDIYLLANANASPSKALAAFERNANQSHVRITSIDPAPATPVATPTPGDLVKARDMQVTIEGNYAGIVGFVYGLSQTDVLMGVDSLSVTGDGGGPHALRVVVGVTTYDVSMTRGEEIDASGTAR
jgi:hypothetical protein